MTDTQEAMYAGYEAFVKEQAEKIGMPGLLPRPSYVRGWKDATAQSAEKIARLEGELAGIKNFTTAHRSYRIAAWQCDYARRQLAAAELRERRYREALEYYQDAVCDSGKINYEYDSEDDGKIAREALAQQPSTEALDAYVVSKLGEPVACAGDLACIHNMDNDTKLYRLPPAPKE